MGLRIIKSLSIKLYGVEYRNYKTFSFMNEETEEREFRRKIVNRLIIKYIALDEVNKEYYVYFQCGNCQVLMPYEIHALCKKVPKHTISQGIRDEEKIFEKCMAGVVFSADF